ncbi:hypothetical protein HYPSUDRAFT_44094 [Hypholoma sublateritium FD-334 SS-4]|uniref:BTB domain-containing protein n=1 Tax=Hypholoma sublateritium (strain FD-334 SS-4) TaxID=945553 RepID=A0A0D2M898_HYPSF|nr:hypothetical protein HYPSUDRAFT_44094 [Hypholoma sublateritium FD-334 SS-4]
MDGSSRSEGKDAPASPALKIAPDFCDAHADVTFKSSDDVLFKMHSKYLAATSGVLQVPAKTMTSPDEVVPLAEPAEILDMLFQFIHPRTAISNFRQPLVVKMDASMLFPLAEAAEKYQVFGAMNTCTTHIYHLIKLKEHPLEILNHTYRHGYLDLADEAAIETIGKPLEEVVRRLTHPGLLRRWLLYYVHWRNVAAAAAKELPQYMTRPGANCTVWPSVKANYMLAVIGNSWSQNYALDHGQNPCNVGSCNCARIIVLFQERLSLGIKSIPKFSEVKGSRLPSRRKLSSVST